MFRFVRKVFFIAMTFFNLSCVNSLKCIAMKNQEFETKPKK